MPDRSGEVIVTLAHTISSPRSPERLMRTLIVIPIIHAEQDMGSMREAIKQEYVTRHGDENGPSISSQLSRSGTEFAR